MFEFIGTIPTKHPERIKKIALSKRKLIALDYEGKLEVWKIDDLLKNINWKEKNISLSENQINCFTCNEEVLIIGDNSGNVHFLDIETHEEVSEPITLSSTIYELSIDQNLIAICESSRLSIWNYKKKLFEIKDIKIDLIPDELGWRNKELYGLTAGGTVKKYLKTGEVIPVLGTKELLNHDLVEHPFSFVVKDEKLIVGTEEGTVFTYNIKDKKIEQYTELDDMDRIQHLLLHKSILFCSLTGEIIMVNFPELEIIQRFPADDGLVESIDYQDGFFAAGTANGTVWLWKKEK